MHLRAHVAGIDDQDAEVGPLEGEDAAGVLQGGLGGAVAPPSLVRLDRSVRGDVHDGRVPVQQPVERLDQGDGSHDVDVEHPQQDARVDVPERGEGACPERAGVVDEEAHGAELSCRPGQRRPVRRVSDVSADPHHVGVPRQPRHRGIESVAPAGVDDEGPAVPCEGLRECQPQSLGSAGDDSNGPGGPGLPPLMLHRMASCP